MLDRKILLLISESRKQPLTESFLYKQIVRFFEQEKIADKFEIAFISIKEGIVTLSHSYIVKENNNAIIKQCSKLPPKNFRSGRVVVSKEQIEQMADSIVDYLRFKILDLRFYKSKIVNHKSKIKVVAYCRGAYLEAVRLASKKSGIEIKEIFSDDELAQLKKKGIMWMKVGLRMPTAFIIFRLKIKEIVKGGGIKQTTQKYALTDDSIPPPKECEREPRQLKLPF